MRNILLIILILVCSISHIAAFGNDEMFDHNYQAYSSYLGEYVKNGKVEYQSIKNNPGALDNFLDSINLVNKSEYNTWSKDKKLSFNINIYNAATLKLVATNYPIKSIKDIDDPWDQKIIGLFGELISLNHLEHEIIRKEFNEPRIHFALVCAAKGCPLLISEAYTADNLEFQLENSTKKYLYTENINRIDKTSGILYLSQIFNWFKEDFESEYGTVINFLKPYYGNEPDLSTFKIVYTDYDWSLNDIG